MVFSLVEVTSATSATGRRNKAMLCRLPTLPRLEVPLGPSRSLPPRGPPPYPRTLAAAVGLTRPVGQVEVFATARIFISHRREDARYARGLQARLFVHFGEKAAVTDDETLPHDSVSIASRLKQVEKNIASYDALVLLIGPNWLKAAEGGQRLDQPDDSTRLEVRAALELGMWIVPVLVNGASMPTPTDLPQGLTDIARRQAIEITDSNWARDTDRLIHALEEATRSESQIVLGSDESQIVLPSGPVVVGSSPPDHVFLASLLAKSARRGVLPVSARPASEAIPPAASTDAAWGPPRRIERRLLSRGVLLAGAGVAALAGVIAWLAGCTLDVPLDEEEESEADPVDCTVFAPPSARRGERLFVQVFAHLPPDAELARALATEWDTATKRRAVKSLALSIPRGSMLSFQLEMPGALVEEELETLRWNGRAQSVQFVVALPEDLESSVLIGTVSVSLGSVPIGHVKFKLDVGIDRDRPTEAVGDDARRYRSAFISYASQDRDHALRGAQMLRAVGVRCFQDVLDLEPGERWERRLYSSIGEGDLFILFWSNAAHDSEWVRKEAQYALDCKISELDPPEIKPIILERPPAPPWPELAHLHFNDRAIYFMSG